MSLSVARTRKGTIKEHRPHDKNEPAAKPCLGRPPSDGAGVHVAMIGDLPHNVIDDEVAIAIFVACDKRKGLDHESFLFVGGSGAMVAENGHWSIAGIAI
jgi:hypothetical protein